MRKDEFLKTDSSLVLLVSLNPETDGVLYDTIQSIHF